ncbi:hypothetical protein SE17_26480 [Kouleothrix aurantiaca]|uniref:FHA domain-containing protein n=1 Tax=Kouleothrix aurantiaca TaxID=186479 RepID=A0A0P9F226_9CHLR|nr:hypothetical protein SE17_26480 [Kouleothrix aurantiaca]
MPTDTSPYAGSARLRAHDEVVQPEEFVLGVAPCHLGRDPKNDIVIGRGAVSRKHALIERHDNHFVLRDVGSSNGTFVNGDRLSGEYRLRNSDRIGLGSPQLLLEFVDQETTDLSPQKLLFRAYEQRFEFHGVPLALSPSQLHLLKHLYDHRNLSQICTHESCVLAIWQGEKYDPARIELVHRKISELRQKFRAIEPHSEVIQSRHGIGYYLDLSK